MSRIKEHEVDWSPLADIEPVLGVRGYSHFTAEEGERIRQFCHANNISASWVARHFGIRNHITVYNIMNRVAKFDREPLRLVSLAQTRKLHARYMAGEHIKSLAAEVGCPYESLRRRFRDNGMKIKPQYQATRDAIKQLRPLLRSGKTNAEAAAIMGVHPTRITQLKRTLKQHIERELL